MIVQPDSVRTPEVEAVRAFYDAVNNNDIPGALANFHPDIVRIEFEGSPSGGTFRGLAEVETHFLKARATWAEGSCEPERLIASGNKVFSLAHVHVRLKDRTDWIDGKVAEVFTFRNGKVIHFQAFTEESEALEMAGVQE